MPYSVKPVSATYLRKKRLNFSRPSLSIVAPMDQTRDMKNKHWTHVLISSPVGGVSKLMPPIFETRCEARAPGAIRNSSSKHSYILSRLCARLMGAVGTISLQCLLTKSTHGSHSHSSKANIIPKWLTSPGKFSWMCLIHEIMRGQHPIWLGST